jgi:hypothetical protein
MNLAQGMKNSGEPPDHAPVPGAAVTAAKRTWLQAFFYAVKLVFIAFLASRDLQPQPSLECIGSKNPLEPLSASRSSGSKSRTFPASDKGRLGQDFSGASIKQGKCCPTSWPGSSSCKFRWHAGSQFKHVPHMCMKFWLQRDSALSDIVKR